MSNPSIEVVSGGIGPGLEVEWLPVRPIHELDDEPIGGHRTPFPGLLDKLGEVVPVVVETRYGRQSKNAPVLGWSEDDPSVGLRRPDVYHHRSSDVIIGASDPERPAQVVWGDAEGPGRYTTLSLKGNFSVVSGIHPSETAPSGFLVWGLQQSDVVCRTVMASRAMIKAGVTTERVDAVLEPQLFRWRARDGGSQHLAVDDFKQALLERFGERAGSRQVDKAAKALADQTFYVTVRSVDTSTRIQEFRDAKDGPHASKLRQTFDLIRLFYPDAHGARSADNPEDVEWYHTDFLPGEIGRNLGRMHRAGLAHGFPHIGNITALGSLVDTDSVMGESLGDDPRTFSDYKKDIDALINGELGGYGTRELLPVIAKELGLDEQQLTDRFERTFWREYLMARYDIADTVDPEALLTALNYIANDDNIMPIEHELVEPLLAEVFDESIPPVFLDSPDYAQRVDAVEQWFARKVDDVIANALRELLSSTGNPISMIRANMRSKVSKAMHEALRGGGQDIAPTPESGAWVRDHLSSSTWTPEQAEALVGAYISGRTAAAALDAADARTRLFDRIHAFQLAPDRALKIEKSGLIFLPDFHYWHEMVIGRQVTDVVTSLRFEGLGRNLVHQGYQDHSADLVVHPRQYVGGQNTIEIAPGQTLQQLVMSGVCQDMQADIHTEGGMTLRFTNRFGKEYLAYTVRDDANGDLAVHIVPSYANIKVRDLTDTASRKGYKVTRLHKGDRKA